MFQKQTNICHVPLAGPAGLASVGGHPLHPAVLPRLHLVWWEAHLAVPVPDVSTSGDSDALHAQMAPAPPLDPNVTLTGCIW